MEILSRATETDFYLTCTLSLLIYRFFFFVIFHLPIENHIGVAYRTLKRKNKGTNNKSFEKRGGSIERKKRDGRLLFFDIFP